MKTPISPTRKDSAGRATTCSFHPSWSVGCMLWPGNVRRPDPLALSVSARSWRLPAESRPISAHREAGLGLGRQAGHPVLHLDLELELASGPSGEGKSITMDQPRLVFELQRFPCRLISDFAGFSQRGCPQKLVGEIQSRIAAAWIDAGMIDLEVVRHVRPGPVGRVHLG